MRKFLLNTILLVFIVSFLLAIRSVMADEYDDVTKKLIDLKRSLESSQTATKNNEQNLKQLNTQLNNIKLQVTQLTAEIEKKQKEVRDGELALNYQKKILDQRTLSYYKSIDKNTFNLLDIVLADNLSKVLENFFYQKTLLDEDKRMIIKIVTYIKDLEEKRTALLKEEAKLTTIKQEVDKQSQFLAGEVSKSKEYEKNLEGQIAQLSTRQQQIVAQKLSALNISRSAGTPTRGCSSDLTNGKDPGFSPRIGFFTYGAPHRNGLNQYGAWGRAKAGQNEEQILQAYYPNFSLKKDYDTNIQISTDTGWTGSIEDYVKRIYEVPDSWTDNNLAVLKAQAVAARTYALRSTSNGSNRICTTEACQVFHNDPKGGNWEQAVEATKGWVMMDGGSLGFTQYASTHGGYILNLGKFDGPGGNPGSFSELNERAYDKDSPWFYCNWGSRSQYGGTAWLKPNEIADIFNTIELARRDSGVSDKLYQPDKPHPEGREVWSQDRVKQELKSRGGNPLDTIDNVSVSIDFGSGKTTSVSGGGVTVSGNEFKDWFNLRAPANIQIVGPLFNVEKK